MKLSIKDRKLLYYLAGFVVLLLVYTLVFNPQLKKNAETSKELDNVKRKLNVIEEHAARAGEYQAETQKMQADMKKIVEEFSPNILEEDVILHANNLESISEMIIDYLGVVEPVEEYVTGSLTEVVDTGNEVTSGMAIDEMHLFTRNIVYNFQSSYEHLKDNYKYFFDKEKRKKVSSISVAYDEETGELTGTMEIGMFYLTGTDAVYHTPDISGTALGLDDVFQSGTGGASIGTTRQNRRANSTNRTNSNLSNDSDSNSNDSNNDNNDSDN